MQLQFADTGCKRNCHIHCSRWAAGVPRPALQQQRFCRGRPCVIAAAQNTAGEDFGESVKRIAKKIQGALPIVGLLSRLAAPEGGFDETAYPEFCRAAYETADERFRIALVELDRKYGKLAKTKWTLLVLWMAKYGVGLVPNKDIMAAARRMRVSQDIEIEIGRFEDGRDAVIKKYSLMERPKGKLSMQLEVACDTICTLSLGLKDGVPVPEAEQQYVADIMRYGFPEATDEQLLQAVQTRPERASAYK